MSIAYLLSGSNQGNRAGILKNALDQINKLAGKVIECSAVYESPSWGFDHPSSFLNQAIKLETSLEPEALLQTLLHIELNFGRVRDKGSEHYQARTLDIDILLYDDIIIEREDLVLPHPRMHLRRFALEPLREIEPELVHPKMGKNISELLNLCTDESKIVKITSKQTYCKKEVGNAV